MNSEQKQSILTTFDTLISFQYIISGFNWKGWVPYPWWSPIQGPNQIRCQFLQLHCGLNTDRWDGEIIFMPTRKDETV